MKNRSLCDGMAAGWGSCCQFANDRISHNANVGIFYLQCNINILQHCNVITSPHKIHLSHIHIYKATEMSYHLLEIHSHLKHDVLSHELKTIRHKVWTLKRPQQVTPLPNLVNKMCKYERDPASILHGTERTRFRPEMDGLARRNQQTLFQIRWSRGCYYQFICILIQYMMMQ